MGKLLGSGQRSAPSDSITPIFVLGATHSGTTILYKMLAMHPDACWFSQYSLRDGQVPGLSSIPGHRIIERALRRLSQHDWQKLGRKRRWSPTRRLLPRPHGAELIWRSYLLPLAMENPESPATRFLRVFQGQLSISNEEAIDRMRRVIHEECVLRGKRFHVSKPIGLYRHMERMRQAFSSARFVHIVRDGRAAALSNRAKAAKAGVPPEEALDLAARRWLDEVEWVSSHKDSDTVDVRYEDLCLDVHAEVAGVLEKLGMEGQAFPFDRCPATLSSTNGRWLDRASSKDLARLERKLDPYLARYGYLTSSNGSQTGTQDATRA